jgi:3D (Asp-Asp-Asp) domain-containing protein
MGNFASFALAPPGRASQFAPAMMTRVTATFRSQVTATFRSQVTATFRSQGTATFRIPGAAAVLRGLAFITLLALTACASLVPASVPPVLPAPPAAIEAPTPEPPPAAASRDLERTLRVKASAYNSVRAQTDSTPAIGAWGDRLAPGMKVIAVSSDLLELGLERGQVVRIRGLDGEYTVADRMSKRWSRKIDIYMGTDVRAARNWGVRDVEIDWTVDARNGAPEDASAWTAEGN